MDLNLPCYVPPNERARLIYQNGFCAKMRRIAARPVVAAINAENSDAACDAALHLAGMQLGLYRRHTRKAIGGVDLRTNKGAWDGGEVAEVSAAGDEFGKSIKFDTLTLSKSLNFAIL